MLPRLSTLAAMVFALAILAACSKPRPFTWREEVRLNDGSIVVVTQRKSCELPVQNSTSFGCIEREAWLTLSLPAFSPAPILWHESLHPRVVNVHDGHLYIIGEPPTSREAQVYGTYGISPYISFIWDSGQWKRIPIAQVPEAIYSTNMLIEGIPPKDVALLTLELKDSERVNGDPGYAKHQKKVDPNYVKPELPRSIPQGEGVK